MDSENKNLAARTAFAGGIDSYMLAQSNVKYGAIYRPKVNVRGGERHDFFSQVQFTPFDSKEAMEAHIRSRIMEADCYEYIKYETLKVEVKVNVQ